MLLLSVYAACAHAQTTVGSHRVDLSTWGYKATQHRDVLHLDSPIVSTGIQRVAAGFVTRDRFGLATRANPPLTLHVIQFTDGGQFISEQLVPTSSWTENGLYFLADGSLLVRAGDRLKLFSSSMDLISDRDLWPANAGHMGTRQLVY